MYDTHCHLTFQDFEGRVDRVVADANTAGVRGIISVSTTSANAPENLAIARRIERVWCTAGVHPLYADEPVDWDLLGAVASEPECVAWGELGLDNHYELPPRDLQDRILAAQLAYIESRAREGVDLPIVVHCRKAVDELLAAFRATPFDPSRFVFHCFTGTAEEARRIIDFGAWISFTGVVTFANAPEVAEAATIVPLDRIMVETDAPFLSPEPHRKVRPNEPRLVPFVARRIARLRGMPEDELERILDDNAERFFGLPPT